MNPVDPTAEYEGPIDGGIYSSPVIAPLDTSAGTENPVMACIFAASDRQVYAVNAATGKLIWKGPGVTKSENEGLPMAGGWNASGPALAYGGINHYTSCVSDSGNASAVTWTFDPTADRVPAGEPAGGLSYSVSAWIPPPGSEGQRAPDATYTITFAGSSGTTSQTVKVDQSDPTNQGKWVQIGGSYFNVSQVALSNLSASASVSVVADAVMIVPDTIGAFSYSTPVADTNPADAVPTAENVYAASSNGRVLGFSSMPAMGNYSAHLNWIYPGVRTTLNSGIDSEDKPSLGQIGSSLSLDLNNERLYVADFTSDEQGDVRCLQGVNKATFGSLPSDGTDGGSGWIFPDPNGVEQKPAWTAPVAGFTSSPALDTVGNQLLIGATDGTFYCLNTSNSGTPNWTYPATSTTLPPGAFRYSTPAIANDMDGLRRAWAGSSDGHVYSFDLTNPSTVKSDRRLWVDTSVTPYVTHGSTSMPYYEPTLLAPLQSSVGLDTANDTYQSPRVMLVGDMSGMLHWNSPNTGTSTWQAPDTSDSDGTDSTTIYTGFQAGDEIFSSPNLSRVDVDQSSGSTTTNYVYVGTSRQSNSDTDVSGGGRLVAFSEAGGAWGGKWAGGTYWPFPGAPNSNGSKAVQINGDTDVQFDMFTPAFYMNSLNQTTSVRVGPG